MDTHLLKPIDWPKLFATIDALAIRRSPEITSMSEPTSLGEGHTPDEPQADAADADDIGSALDQATLDDLRETFGAETADEIVDMFAGELDDRVARMTASAAAEGAAAEAHALASAARSIGCVKLADLCKDLERSVRAGETDIGPKLSDILTAATNAGKAIANLRKAG
jgi:HPt (histidine-containing phosphotransfer) domain-containing protein